MAFGAKAFTRRVFQNKSKADFALEIKWLNEWADGLDEEEKEEAKAEIKEMGSQQVDCRRAQSFRV